MVRLHLAVVAVVVLPCLAAAQESRYELGQRLRAFEAEWERVADAAARKRTLPHLKQATTAFFAAFLDNRFEEAARGLDLARLALTTEKPDPAVLWAESCVVKVDRRFAEKEVKVTLAPFYKPRQPQPDGVKFHLSNLNPPVDIKELPLTLSVPLSKGDNLLRASITRNGKVLAGWEQLLSQADRIEDRLNRVEKELAGKSSTDLLTARNLLSLLRKLHKGDTLETNYPAARLLSEIEGVLASLQAERCYYCRERPGRFWLNVAVGTRSVPIRVQVPEQAKAGKPLPLVIALHGAGGSENMFFDGYGNGAVAKLCAERGWLLATTRAGLADGLVEELAKLYPVDARKVFLVGHSMGAGQAVAAASARPAKFAGVAALGGGGRIRPSEGLKGVQFYVGVGKDDFALGGARALKASLERAEIDKVVYREFDDVEHLVIVQLSLPDVFRTFDRIVKP